MEGTYQKDKNVEIISISNHPKLSYYDYSEPRTTNEAKCCTPEFRKQHRAVSLPVRRRAIRRNRVIDGKK